jgi:hypothetical protein
MPTTEPDLATILPLIGNPEEIDRRHGGAFDRGQADDYYWRAPNPHKFEGATYHSDPIPLEEGTKEWAEYWYGFLTNDDKKDWGI